MDQFWQYYWWVILITILIGLILIYILYRIYQIYHFDYNSERNLHFPQWSNEGIITRDNYFIHTKFNFINNSKYIVIGIHGIGASLTDFKLTAQYFMKQNISFISFDQRGFGENEKWKYHTLGTTINDIKDIINVLNERYPNKKIILMGESLGSAFSALTAKKLPKIINGIILTNFVTKKRISKLTPILLLQIIWGFMVYKHQPLAINFNLKDISNNKNYIKKSNIRNITNMKFTLLFYIQAQKLSKQVPKNINNSICPTLIIQSGEDMFANDKIIKHNNEHWRTGITYHFYNKGKHAILNEPNIDHILADINQWIITNI